MTATKEKLNQLVIFLCASCFFFSFHLVNLPALPRPGLRATDELCFYDPDCELTLSCLRRGHDRQEDTLKLKSQDSFYFQSFFSLFLHYQLPIPYFHRNSCCLVTSWYEQPTLTVCILSGIHKWLMSSEEKRKVQGNDRLNWRGRVTPIKSASAQITNCIIVWDFFFDPNSSQS